MPMDFCEIDMHFAQASYKQLVPEADRRKNQACKADCDVAVNLRRDQTDHASQPPDQQPQVTEPDHFLPLWFEIRKNTETGGGTSVVEASRYLRSMRSLTHCNLLCHKRARAQLVVVPELLAGEPEKREQITDCKDKNHRRSQPAQDSVWYGYSEFWFYSSPLLLPSLQPRPCTTLYSVQLSCSVPR